jgi:hypothetical protein
VLALVWRQLVQPRNADLYSARSMNHLSWFAVIHHKGRSQHFVTPNDLIEALLQRVNVEWAFQTVSYGHSVCRVAKRHLVYYPHLHLSEGEWSRLSCRPFGNDALSHGLGNQTCTVGYLH